MRCPAARPRGDDAGARLGACSSGGGSKPTIKIGSDGFDEAKLMAEIYAQALEANGYTVDRAGIGLGGRKVTAPALESGQIDLKPEYIGSGLALLRAGQADRRPGGQPDRAPDASSTGKGGGITRPRLHAGPGPERVRRPQGDGRPVQPHQDERPGGRPDQLKFGLATDCPTNPVCGAALKDAYGIDLGERHAARAVHTPMAQALLGKTIDVAELCSTQPDIIVNGWVVLQDDKQTQPADNIAPLVRNDYLAKVDKAAFEKILNDVSAKMDTPTLADLVQAGRGRQEGHRGRRQGLAQGQRLREVARPPFRAYPSPRPSAGASSIPGSTVARAAALRGDGPIPTAQRFGPPPLAPTRPR